MTKVWRYVPLLKCVRDPCLQQGVVGKMFLYHHFRSFGVRLYSTRSWTKAVCCSDRSVQRPECIATVRSQSTAQVEEKQPSAWLRFREYIGKPKLKYPKVILGSSAFKLYMCCTEIPDIEQQIIEQKLPDEFISWFVLALLHVWLVNLRLSSEGHDGKFIAHYMVQALWDDSKKRAKALFPKGKSFNERKHLEPLGHLFLTSLFEYDAGLLGDDTDLAGAVWRMIYKGSEDADPVHIAQLVHYIRKQVKHLQEQETEKIMKSGVVTFLQFYGDQIDHERTNHTLSLLTNTKFRF